MVLVYCGWVDCVDCVFGGVTVVELFSFGGIYVVWLVFGGFGFELGFGFPVGFCFWV